MYPSGETFISVDIETAGPYPADYSLLSIGACTLDEPRQTFYIELKPVHPSMTPEAFAIHGLSLLDLEERGLFARYLKTASGRAVAKKRL